MYEDEVLWLCENFNSRFWLIQNVYVSMLVWMWVYLRLIWETLILSHWNFVPVTEILIDTIKLTELI